MATKAATPSKAADKMTQAQIITALADKVEVNKKIVKQLFDEMGKLAIEQTKKNGVFVVPNVGRLVKSERKARLGRNPQTGEKIKIAAKKVVKFRVSKACKDAIVPPKKK